MSFDMGHVSRNCNSVQGQEQGSMLSLLSRKHVSKIMLANHGTYKNILTHTSNAKCFRNVTLINIRGLAEIIVPARGYGRHSPSQVMI